MFNRKIKKLCALVLAATMSLTLLGCGGEPEESVTQTAPTEPSQPVIQTQPTEPETQPTEDDGLVTIYCLVQTDYYIGGALRKRSSYKYDGSGNLIAIQYVSAGADTTWNEELGVYEYIPLPFEDSASISWEYFLSYDNAGNITESHCLNYDDGSVTNEFINYYRYFFNEKGEIIYVAYTPSKFWISPLNYYFTYENGKIVNVDAYMTTDDGEVYGDVVNNFHFDYDDQGRLSEEHITLSSAEYRFTYTYDAQGRVKSVDCYGCEDEEETQKLHEFSYNEQKNIISQKEDDSYYSDYLYYAGNQRILLEYIYHDQDAEFMYDENGNLIVSYNGDFEDRCEYTYEAIEVTPEQAERYYRQQQMLYARGRGWYTDFYYPVFFYHLIPNPIW